ncbi:uncharacterized protein UTRI_05246_B [Ustilago trichophora]|uniref:DRBM domain-containing protein n=1 Tax=Ustilago trichophora TaxID=86804 RepID=A0A5C3EKY1_9BASI|nr:uncharacterized protein UTRI_05246_B [Ustilago trichophora]
MPSSAKYDQTNANLQAIGAGSIPLYLPKAFPTPSPSQEANAATGDFVDSARLTIDHMLQSSTTTSGSTGKLASEEAEEARQEEEDVPFYVKTRGKGKGKPVFFDLGKSSVAQIFEYAAQKGIPDPVFCHSSSGAAHILNFSVTVTFAGLTTTNADHAFAGSIKEAKEQACFKLARMLLERQKRGLITSSSSF